MTPAGRRVILRHYVAAPTITSSAGPSVAENATLSHALTANQAVTWSLVGGADLAKFELNGASTLRFASNATKDYEAPDDADTNNTYVVTVRATNVVGRTATQTVTVTVTDLTEAPLPNPTTWNPSDKSANCTLSNGDKTAVCGTVGGSLSGLKAVAGKTSGKYYCEFVLTGSVNNNMTLGIANSSAPNTAFGINTNSLGLFGGGGVFRNGSQVGTDGTGSSGATVSMAVDRDNNKIWFRVNGGDWNNNAANDPATNTGGIDISGVSGTIFPAWNGFSSTDTNVANFGSTAFTYAVPSGFTTGWPS